MKEISRSYEVARNYADTLEKSLEFYVFDNLFLNLFLFSDLIRKRFCLSPAPVNHRSSGRTWQFRRKRSGSPKGISEAAPNEK
jgi:hypothetical protein